MTGVKGTGCQGGTVLKTRDDKGGRQGDGSEDKGTVLLS